MRMLLGIFALMVVGQVLYGLRFAVENFAYVHHEVIGFWTLMFGAVMGVMVLTLLGLAIYERILKIRREYGNTKNEKGFYLYETDTRKKKSAK